MTQTPAIKAYLHPFHYIVRKNKDYFRKSVYYGGDIVRNPKPSGS